MWVAMLVAMVMTSSGAQIGVQVAPQPFHSKAECEAANASVEGQVKEVPDIKGYVLKCVEVSKEEIKTNGKDA